MNIGVLGGTFDPPHDAHLRIAERSIDQFSLDKVIFITFNKFQNIDFELKEKKIDGLKINVDIVFYEKKLPLIKNILVLVRFASLINEFV